MEIIPLPVKSPKILHKWLPSQHTMITAPTGSGKTVLLINMIARTVFPYSKYYKQIHVYSPTINIDNNWDLLKNDKSDKYILKENLDLQDIFDLVSSQEERILIKGKNKCKHHLLIIDDFAGQMKNSENKYLIELIMKLRHSNIHLWLTTQSYRAIPRAMRLQFMYHIIFRVSPQELDIMSTEINGSIEEKISKSMHMLAITERPFNFMYVDIKKQAYFSGFLYKLIINQQVSSINGNVSSINKCEGIELDKIKK